MSAAMSSKQIDLEAGRQGNQTRGAHLLTLYNADATLCWRGGEGGLPLPVHNCERTKIKSWTRFRPSYLLPETILNDNSWQYRLAVGLFSSQALDPKNVCALVYTGRGAWAFAASLGSRDHRMGFPWSFHHSMHASSRKQRSVSQRCFFQLIGSGALPGAQA